MTLGLIALASLAVTCDQSAPPAPALAARRCTIPPLGVDEWRVHTDGTHFRDERGRELFLRGVNAGGRSKFAPFVPFDYPSGGFDTALAQYLDRAAAWGVDVLRLPFSWAGVEPAQGADDADYLARYDAMIDAAWARGIWVVVDFHQDAYSEVYCGDGFPAWTIPDPHPSPHHDCPNWITDSLTDPGVKAAWDAFWANGSTTRAAYLSLWNRMATRYVDRAGVLGFELLNEPGVGSVTDTNTWESTVLTSFYSDVIAHVRAVAASTLIFVEPIGADGVSATTTLARPVGEGLVFAPHYYQLTAFSDGPLRPDEVSGSVQSWASTAAAWSVPLFLGEFGVSNTNSDAATLMTAHFDAFDALGVSGTEWEYSVAAESWNSETLGMVGADGTAFPVAFAIVRPYARAVAGTAIVSAYDASSGVYTLSFAPSLGTVFSDVSVPPAAYPTGSALTLTGACVDDSTPGRLRLLADEGATSVRLRVDPR
ncbi:MAG: cellulase family glycosylhydrolase [Polyangiales bacterium]